MYREEINNLVKDNEYNVINYLITFTNTLKENYDTDPENLCKIFNFIIEYKELDHINTKSILRKDNEGLYHIEINDNLDYEETRLQMIKEIYVYFIIEYLKNKNKINENIFFESQFYFHFSRLENECDIDCIIDYFSRTILYETENNKKVKKKNIKKINKLQKKILRLVRQN